MKKMILFYFLVIAVASAHEGSLQREIQADGIIRTTLRLSAKLAYEDSVHFHVDIRPLQGEPQTGTALDNAGLNKYFHDGSRIVLPGYKNCFQGGEVRGCIYSIHDPRFRNKIFISFPGTQSVVEWAKNFFGITHFDNNIQRSYYHDIENIYAHNNPESFLKALYKHINCKNGSYRELNASVDTPANIVDYEYYFTGHSRGGGLALIAAKKFREIEAHRNHLLRVKVATFCTPRIMNAYSIQSRIINLLGYDNVVHFVRPSDLAPRFPFTFVENQGVQIPLQPNAFWFVIHSHRIPDQTELEDSIGQYNTAKEIGWLYPIRYLFTIESKPLLWGAGGFCGALIFVKMNMGTYILGEIKEMYIRMLRRI